MTQNFAYRLSSPSLWLKLLGLLIVLTLLYIALPGRPIRATYTCDDGRYIKAAFYKGEPLPPAVPDMPPTPGGSVKVELSDGRKATLRQTLSASGARYANSDESFVFWNKGDEALIMENNAMNLDYRNCRTSSGNN